jgi:TolA-binding protein
VIGSTGLRFSGALAWVWASVLGAPAAASAADKDVVELQRQVAVLTDKVATLQAALNSLQSAVDQKLGAQGSLLQQIHTENAAAAKTVADQLSQQEQKVAVPVAALNAKIDQVIAVFSATQDNIGDMNSRLGRVEQQIVDMRNVLKVLQAGPPPAPSAPQTPGGPPPGLTAQGLFQDASRDQLSGKSDLALQEYTDYLK